MGATTEDNAMVKLDRMSHQPNRFRELNLGGFRISDTGIFELLCSERVLPVANSRQGTSAYLIDFSESVVPKTVFVSSVLNADGMSCLCAMKARTPSRIFWSSFVHYRDCIQTRV